MRKILLVSLIFLSSCLTQKMNAYVGKDKDEVVGHYGPPEQTLSDGHTGQIYLYTQRRYISNQWGTNDSYRYTMFFIDRHDKVYRWVVRDEPNPPERMDLRVFRY